MIKISRKTLCRLVIIPISCLYAFSQGSAFAQDSELEVTLNAKQQSVHDILSKIKEQTGLSLMYSGIAKRDFETKTDLKVRKEKVGTALRKLLSPMDYIFEIKDRSIIIKKGAQTAGGEISRADSATAGRQLVGTVTDTDGKPIAGANVAVKGRKLGKVTDAEGKFALGGVKESDTISLYMLGFERQKIAAGSKSSVNITLHTAVNLLDETVVSGDGVASHRFATGNISVIKAKDITNQPVSNPLLALQGWVPGLFIEQATGLPGTGVRVRLQGQNSVSRGNDPLYIVDGIPFLSRFPYTLSAIQGGSGSNGVNVAGTEAGAGNPLDLINPADIDSITVLKNVDAVVIYGSRAANGAIVITTKRGVAKPFKIDVTLENGWGVVTRKMQLLNTSQYLAMRAAAYRNDGLPVPDRSTSHTQDNLDLTWYDPAAYTDWQKVLIGGIAQYRNLYAGVSGGKKNTHYQAGIGHRRQTTVFPGELGDTKGSLHAGFVQGSDSTKFKMTITGNYTRSNTALIADDFTRDAISLPPNAPALYGQNGNLNWDTLPNGDAVWTNPLAYLSRQYHNIATNLLAGATAGYKLPYGFYLSGALGYNRLQADDELLQPLSYYAPKARAYEQNKLQVATARMHTWSIEPQLSYHKEVGKGSYTAIIGYSWQEQTAGRVACEGSGFARDEQVFDLSAASQKSTDSTDAYYRFSAIYGTLRRNWDNRYIVSLSMRQDHSSRIEKAARSHTFGSAAAAWIFLDKAAGRGSLPLLSFGKLKAGYCTTGNDGVLADDPYTYNTLLYRPPQPQWEQIRKLSMGMDLGALDNRLSAGINYYHNRSANQLLYNADPVSMGFPRSIRSYNALVQNRGWEFDLHTAKIKIGECMWSADATLTIPQSKLLAFTGLENTPYVSDFVVGQPLNIVRAYPSAGVDPETGLNRIRDRNGKILPPGVLGTPEDLVINVRLAPRYYGGIHNRLIYRGFELDVFFQFVKQMGPLYNWGNQPGMFNGVANTGNQPVAVLNAWQKTGDITNIPKASSSLSDTTYASYINGVFSSAVYGDASYVRLKNLALSYTFHKKGNHPADIKVFVHAQNLFTFTGYKGLDSETKSAVSLPPLKVITLGINFTLQSKAASDAAIKRDRS